MSCDFITGGRLLPCKEFIGGLYKVWFAEYGTVDPMIDLIDTDASYLAITGFTEPITIYEFELKGTSNLSQEIISSRENSGTYVTQTLTLDLGGADKDTNNKLKLLAHGRPHIFVQDNYGSIWYCGKDRGMDLTSGVFATGAAYGDKYGYTVTFVGTENEYADYVWGPTADGKGSLTDPFGGMTLNEPTPVTGS